MMALRTPISFWLAILLILVGSVAFAQSRTLTGTAIGAAGGMAVGAGTGYGVRYWLCQSNAASSCPGYTEVYLPSIVVGGAVGAGIGALIGHYLQGKAPVAVYPTVGIGTYEAAPGLILQGHF